MPRGGKRPNAGRRAKAKKPAAPSIDVAQEILEFLALDSNPHPGECRCLKCRWRRLSDVKDERLRYTVENSLLNRILGLPAQTIDSRHEFDPDAPLKVVIEHIGSPNKASTKAK